MSTHRSYTKLVSRKAQQHSERKSTKRKPQSPNYTNDDNNAIQKRRKTLPNFFRTTRSLTPLLNNRNSTKKNSSVARSAPTVMTKLPDEKRFSTLLKTMCNHSGTCIAFGIEREKMNTVFKKFVKFDLVTSIKPLSNGDNGFVKELCYEKEGYKAFAVLKSSSGEGSDNLFWEYYAGLQINKWIPFLPCFVETYGLFKYIINEELIQTFAETKQLSFNPLHKHFIPHPLHERLVTKFLPSTVNPNYDFADICKNGHHYSLLVQHLHNSKTFHEQCNLKTNTPEDILVILSQVYFALNALFLKFSHNDLHAGNILLFEPYPGKYITMIYKFPNKSELIIKSRFIAKIIDYGRCFVPNSAHVINSICKTPACFSEKTHSKLSGIATRTQAGGSSSSSSEHLFPSSETTLEKLTTDHPSDCGDEYGFWFQPLDEKNTFQISARNLNYSHDLRLLRSFLPDHVEYGVGMDKKNEKFGTLSNPEPNTDGKISNIRGAFDFFHEKIKIRQHEFRDATKFPENKCFATMIIDLSLTTPIQFQVNTSTT